MELENHLNLILDKYKLRGMYRKYIAISMSSTIIKESFYWALLYLNNIIQDKPENLIKYSIFIICLYCFQIPFKTYSANIKTEFIKELRLANIKYFSEKIINITKDKILNLDLIEYYTALDHFNDYFQEYITSQQIKYDIPIRCITLVIIATTQDFNLLIGLFAVFYSIIIVLNERKLIKESDLTKELYDTENQVRNYMINSKHFIINDEFNNDYFNDKTEKAEQLNKMIFDTNNNLDTTINILLFCFIIMVFYIRRKTLEPISFLYYFLMIYDIEWIVDKVSDYYKNKVNYNRMKERLVYLNSITKYSMIVTENIEHFNNNIPDITIDMINNDMPRLISDKKIIINKNDHILVQGESGSGKTSILYILKGMVKCNKLIIKPNIDNINNNSYIMLSNNKSIFSGNLYDIITNYENNPDIELIDEAIKISKMEHKFNNNSMIDIEKLSGGERIRLIIARLIYLVKKNNRSILLFDEIDDNLNNVLAVEIASNLLEIFKDKTILYITHNEKVKELFKKKITVVNGNIINETNQ